MSDLHRSCLGKKFYTSFELALKVARRCMQERPHTPKLRVYYCGICNYYHLTSTPERTPNYGTPISPPNV